MEWFTMGYSLPETCLQGILVVVFIILDLINTTTKGSRKILLTRLALFSFNPLRIEDSLPN